MITELGKKYISLLSLTVIQIVVFAYVFGKKILNVGSTFFAGSYDASKNYFAYYYYTNIQSKNNFVFEGMNYPFGDYIFYVDNTPIIAVIVKAFNLPNAIAIYNSIFLLLWFIVPFIGFAILRTLKVNDTIAVLFSLLMCWTNPLLNHFGSTVNLSLFVFYLLAFLLFIKHILARQLSAQLLFVGLQIVLLYIASFFHLYYLPITVLFLGGAYFLIALLTKKYRYLWQTTFLFGIAGVSVFLSIYLIDDYYSIRSGGSSGYGYDLFKNSLTDLFKSLVYLDFPNPLRYKEWGDQKWGFLGSGYTVAIIIFIISVPVIRMSKWDLTKKIMLAATFGGLICFLVSMGHTITLFGGKINITNYLNPFFYASKVTDFVTHFRYLRRFSSPTWMMFFIGLAFVSSLLMQRVNLKATIVRVALTIFVLISCFDAYQYIRFHHINYEHENLFTNKSLENVPDFSTEKFDAIFPIPYFHVGTDDGAYTIDDPDNWSRYLYQLSVKNKLPLMACKMGRTPPSFAEQSFSLFADSTSPELLERLNGKKILLTITENEEWHQLDVEWVQDLKSRQDFFLEKHDTKLIAEKDGINYYEMYAR